LFTFTNSKEIFKPNQTLDLYTLKFEKQKLINFHLLENVKRPYMKRKLSLTKF